MRNCDSSSANQHRAMAVPMLVAMLVLVRYPALADDADAPKARPAVELTVSPETVKIDYARRPTWVETISRKDGEIHTVSVASDPWTTQRECDEALDKKLREQVETFVIEHIGNSLAARLIQFDLSYIKKNLIPEDGWFRETIVANVGEMKQSHVLLRFDDSFRQQLDERWRQIIAASRLGQAALIYGGALFLLSVAFGYGRMHRVPRPVPERRLRIGAATMIVAAAIVGVLLARSMIWL